MHSFGRLISTLLFLLAPLGGCSGGGRGGSSGFDISSENAAIRVALESGQCVGFESLNICPAEARASANTPTAAPRVNTDLATATSIDCFQAAPGPSCTYVVRFVAQGFAPSTTFQALSRVDAADNPWVLGPDPRVGGADPSSFSTTLVLTGTGVPPAATGPPVQVQFAILAFAGPPPSSTEVGQLHLAEATYAFMTQELVVNVIPLPTPSPTLTSTPTPTGTPIATGTPGPDDCCQCESNCAAPVDGSCGTCTVVFGSACHSDGLCAVRTPTPTATASYTPTFCADCPRPNVYVPINGYVMVIDTTSNLLTANIKVAPNPPIDSELTGIAASPTSPVVFVGGRFGAVSVLSTNSNGVVGSTPVGRQPFAIGLTPDGGTAYVTDLGLNSISIVDTGTLNTGLSIAGGNQPAAVAATPDGAFVYVVNSCGDGPCFPISRGTVSIIDTHSRTITKTLTLGYRSNGIAMDPGGGFALVANQCGENSQCASEGTLSVIDIGTQTVVDDIPISGQFSSNSIAITPDGRFAYVSNTCGSSPAGCSETDGSVSVVDLLTNSVVGPAITLAGQPVGVAITPDGRTAYVAAQASDQVVAIDTATNTVGATIGVGPHPGFLAIAIPPTRTPPLPTATPQPTASSGVVGTGTADSCTDAALTAALARGGLVTFNCGGPATIDISTGTGTKTITADTTIDGGNLMTIRGGDQVFLVPAGVEFTVQNLTIADNSYAGLGGAIVNDGTLAVTHSTFSDNRSDAGGAINNSGTLTVTDTTFSHNGGGAIANSGTLTVIHSTFSDTYLGAAINNSGTLTVTNSTLAGNNGAGKGGAIYNSGALTTVINSTFSGNSANIGCLFGGCAFGGAIYNSSGMLTVTDSTFTGNSSDFTGGAIDNSGTLIVTNTTFSENRTAGGGAIHNTGTLSVIDSTFSGGSATPVCRRFCSAGFGGAIDNAGTLSVTNSTFAGNTAARACMNTVCSGGLGGAIYNTGSAGTLTVMNSTFVDNSGSDGGGAIDNTITCGDTGAAACSAILWNTIVASSTPGDNCAGPITDGGHNLDDGASCGFSTTNGSLINTEPQLDPSGFQDNSGPTQTIALEAGSPAIDAGDDAICAAAPVNNVDQRGFTRPGTGHPHCSIGAYEFGAEPSGQAGSSSNRF